MDYHHWLEALHIISVIVWMAGMLYLPRLYVYHADVKYNSESDKLLQMMERRLLRIIINPAMIFTLIFGIILAVESSYYVAGWFHVKMLLVVVMLGIHHVLSRYRKAFAKGGNTHSPLFYRILNESVTLVMIMIVIMAVVKPI